jgi:alpha-tubulin suppressor-like RCC1 family protein
MKTIKRKFGFLVAFACFVSIVVGLWSPTSQASSFSVTSIDAGDRFTCAVLSTGSVKCWGWNVDGQLGYANSWDVPNVLSPVDAGNVMLGGNAVSVSVGGSACALMIGGTVRCWGYNTQGQLGFGHTRTIGDDETPASAGDVPLGGLAVSISMGSTHACALMETGAVRCWGSNTYGQLGYGHTRNIGDDETPASAGDVPLGGTAISISTGERHTCALMSSGSVRCWGGWGRNRFGTMGYGNTNAISSPMVAGDIPLGGSAIAIATGSNETTCAVMSTGGLRCWGSADMYQLGYRLNADNQVVGDDETPEAMGDIPMSGQVQSVAIGGYHTCAIFSGGDIRCWGLGDFGLLGTSSRSHVRTAQESTVVDIGGQATTITASGSHTCVTLQTGSARCWGLNQQGELGYGSKSSIGDNEKPSTAGDILFELAVPVSPTTVAAIPPTNTSPAPAPVADTEPPVPVSPTIVAAIPPTNTSPVPAPAPVAGTEPPATPNMSNTSTTLVAKEIAESKNPNQPVLSLRVDELISGKSIANAGQINVPNRWSLRLAVAPGSKKFCRVNGSSIQAIKQGVCKVSVTVRTKSGKSMKSILKITISTN